MPQLNDLSWFQNLNFFIMMYSIFSFRQMFLTKDLSFKKILQFNFDKII